jgi:hypothetical protein
MSKKNQPAAETQVEVAAEPGFVINDGVSVPIADFARSIHAGYEYEILKFDSRTLSAPKLQSVGGYLNAQGYAHPLPALTSVGGSFYAQGYAHPMPALTSVGGYLNAQGYAHPLPALTSVGGSLYAQGYAHPLPALTSVGGSLDARGYAHPLPALTSVGGSLYARGYAHPLPALTSVGGYLVLRDPIRIPDLSYSVTIYDTHMVIGCESHSLSDWAEFDDRKIAAMDGAQALKFWRANKETLLARAAADGRGGTTADALVRMRLQFAA